MDSTFESFKIGFQRVGLFGFFLLSDGCLWDKYPPTPQSVLPSYYFRFYTSIHVFSSSHLNDLFSFVFHLSCSVFNPVSYLFSVVLAGDWLPRKRRPVRWPFVVSFFPFQLSLLLCSWVLASWECFPIHGTTCFTVLESAAYAFTKQWRFQPLYLFRFSNYVFFIFFT